MTIHQDFRTEIGFLLDKIRKLCEQQKCLCTLLVGMNQKNILEHG